MTMVTLRSLARPSTMQAHPNSAAVLRVLTYASLRLQRSQEHNNRCTARVQSPEQLAFPFQAAQQECLRKDWTGARGSEPHNFTKMSFVPLLPSTCPNRMSVLRAGVPYSSNFWESEPRAITPCQQAAQEGCLLNTGQVLRALIRKSVRSEPCGPPVQGFCPSTYPNRMSAPRARI